jgi:hypothetical protein
VSFSTRSPAPRSNWRTDTVTLRAASSVVAFAFVAIAVAVLLADAGLRGPFESVLRGLGPAVLVLWGGWLLLVRPSIRVEPDRAVIVNVGRITEVPWERVADIRRKLQLVLDLDDGRRLEAWGSPFAPRRRGGRIAAADDDQALRVVRSAWMSAQVNSSPSAVVPPVVRRVDAIALGIGAAAVVAVVVSLAA